MIVERRLTRKRRNDLARQLRSDDPGLDVMHPQAAGIDVAVRYRPVGASAVLLRNLFVYGVGGIIVPFVGIKLIDMAITAVGLA